MSLTLRSQTTTTNIEYRWLTSFIFAAQDYNLNACFFEAPPGVTCGRKKANEAFIFLALYVSPPPLSYLINLLS